MGQDNPTGRLDELVDEQGGFPKLALAKQINETNGGEKEQCFWFVFLFCIFVVFPLEIRKVLGASTAGNQTCGPYRD